MNSGVYGCGTIYARKLFSRRLPSSKSSSPLFTSFLLCPLIPIPLPSSLGSTRPLINQINQTQLDQGPASIAPLPSAVLLNMSLAELERDPFYLRYAPTSYSRRSTNHRACRTDTSELPGVQIQAQQKLILRSTGHQGMHGHEFLEFEYSHGELN